MKKITMLIFCLFALTWTYAQRQTVKGHVTDEKGNALSGVSIQVKDSTTGTFTDNSGDFTIQVTLHSEGEAPAQLVFSYVNFETETIPVTKDTKQIKLALKPAVGNLNDVIVVGYGTVLRKDLTGSVSSVSAKDLKDIPINSAEQALAGRLAGVQVTGSEGSPDAEVSIRVRGGGSITQDNSPLYVVDGVIMDNALSTLSPQDIESIDVLKDASATAIYGARGANGVVIITTKQGTAGRTVVTYNGFYGNQKVNNMLDVLNPYDYVFYQFERAQGNNTTLQSVARRFGAFEDIDLYKDAPFVSWQEQLFGRNAFLHSHNVSVSGGDAKTQFNLSATENYNKAVMEGSDYNRQLVNFQIKHKVSSFATMGFNLRFNNQVVNGQGTSNPGSSGLNFLRQTVRYTPFLSPGQSLSYYDPETLDETSGNGLYLVNPLLLVRQQYKRSYQTRVGLSAYADLKLTNFLSFRSTFGYDYYPITTKAFDDSLTSNAISNGNGMPIATINDGKRTTLDISNVFTLSNRRMKGDFHKHHKFDLILGEETYQLKNESKNVIQRYFPYGTAAEQALGNLNLASAPDGYSQPSPTSKYDEQRIWSFFSRLNYEYDNKYLASVSVRADGSTVFGPTNRWGYFPAGSFAWKFTEEKFMEWLKPVLSSGKLRLSYGTAGNNRIASFLYLTQFITNAKYYGLQDNLVTAFAPAALTNANLKWESNISRNLGLDLSFFKDRLQVSADYYRNKTKDLLVNVTVPTSSGYTSQVQNVGATSNNGVELQIGGSPIVNKDFTWNVNFNISFNKNKILSLGNQQSFLVSSGWAGAANAFDYIVKVGSEVGQMYGLVNDGFYTVDDFNYDASTNTYTLKDGVVSDAEIAGTLRPGVIKYKDISGDGKVTIDEDRRIIGNANPKYFGGINQQFYFKGFDMSIFLNFQVGNDIVNDNKLEFTSGYTDYANVLSIEKDRWRNLNDAGELVTDPAGLAALNKNAKLWTPLKTAYSWTPQSWAIEDGSFLRINNITLGYSLPQAVLKKSGIRRFRVYGTVNNLAVITGYSGYDPEVNARRSTPMTPGVDFSAYPRARSFIVGVNVGF